MITAEARPVKNKKSSRRKGPNWANIRKLRNHLAKLRVTKNRKFDMSQYIRILSGKEDGDTVTVSELRKNGPQCGSAACLAGETVILFGPATQKFKVIPDLWSTDAHVDGHKVEKLATKLLGLSYDESIHMFSGQWLKVLLLDEITKKDAIRYLDKVLVEKDVMVRI